MWVIKTENEYVPFKHGAIVDGFKRPAKWPEALSPEQRIQYCVFKKIVRNPVLQFGEKYGAVLPPVESGDECIYEREVVSMSPEELSAALDAVKELKLLELSVACGKQIVGGFNADVLGSTHRYKSTLEDQFNLSGLLAVGGDRMVVCSSDGGVTYSYALHTEAQIRDLFNLGEQLKTGLLQRCRDLKNQVLAAGTKDEVDAVTWGDL